MQGIISKCILYW